MVNRPSGSFRSQPRSTSLTSLPRSGSSLARTLPSTPTISPAWRATTGPAACRTDARIRPLIVQWERSLLHTRRAGRDHHHGLSSHIHPHARAPARSQPAPGRVARSPAQGLAQRRRVHPARPVSPSTPCSRADSTRTRVASGSTGPCQESGRGPWCSEPRKAGAGLSLDEQHPRQHGYRPLVA